MKLISATQMREIDRNAIENLGISGVTLMSNAAEQLAKVAMEHVPPGGKVAVFCGCGNNGDDGIGAATYLIEKGISVRVFLVSSDIDGQDFDHNMQSTGFVENLAQTYNLSPDSNEMYKRLLKRKGSIEPYSSSLDLYDYLNTCAVVIDAIFGIGLNAEIKGTVLSAVNSINASNATIISADIPTGVHADTGAILGDAVNADITVTFSLAKSGLFIEPGCIRCGDVRICDIGIPSDALKSIISSKYAVMANDVSLPRRRPDAHKGDFGRVLIVAGCVGYTGAPALAARSASKMGAGLVSLGVPEPIYTPIASKLTEEMPFPLSADKKGRLNANAASDILRQLEKSTVGLIGPGLGQSEDLTELVESILRLSETPVVLDADALNAISGDTEVLKNARCQLILTPHVGEFVRLGAKPGEDRMKAATDFAVEYGCILVLKGHRTIVALPNGTAYVNTTGGPAMAKGGSGDVLAGMIAALIAQKFPIVHAVNIAVYLHGLAGDLCTAELGEYSVSASDLVEMLPKVIKSIVK